MSDLMKADGFFSSFSDDLWETVRSNSLFVAKKLEKLSLESHHDAYDESATCWLKTIEQNRQRELEGILDINFRPFTCIPNTLSLNLNR